MKQLITIILITFSLTAIGQNRYYFYPADSTPTVLQLSIQSGIANPSARCNVAGDTCILKLSTTLGTANPWLGLPYTAQQVRPIINTAEWGATPPEPIESESRIELARARGASLTNAFFARIDRNVYDGTWTVGQGANAFQNYVEIFGLIDEGLFDLIIKLNTAGQIVPQGVVTQQMLDNLITKLTQFENDHPRP